MALVCNIDSRGREHRYRIGRILIACGALVAGAGSAAIPGKLPWIAGGLLLAAGLFSLFEARMGWCLVRSLGFKTRI